MAEELSGKTIAFVVANEGVEEVELTRPWRAVEEAGGRAVLVAPEAGTVQAFNHLDRGKTFEALRSTRELRPEDYDGVMLPGGVANPDQLRQDGAAVAFIRESVESGKPVAVICHGPWTLVEADVVRGRTLTSWPSLQTDICNAGGHWVDEVVSVCAEGPNTLVSSQKPDDLDAFCQKMIEAFVAGAGQAPV